MTLTELYAKLEEVTLMMENAHGEVEYSHWALRYHTILERIRDTENALKKEADRIEDAHMRFCGR